MIVLLVDSSPLLRLGRVLSHYSALPQKKLCYKLVVTMSPVDVAVGTASAESSPVAVIALLSSFSCSI